MELDWLSICLGILIVLIFLAIFSLLRTMSSPYIKRFEFIVKGTLEPVAGMDQSCRIKFSLDGRDFELLEIKDEVEEKRQKVYNSCVLLKAKTKSDFSLHIDDVLNKVHVAGILVDIKGPMEANCSAIEYEQLNDAFKDFKISSNDERRAQEFLRRPEVVSILSSLKAQFSVYGFLLPFVIDRGDLIIDYSLSNRLLNELVFDPRNILNHALLLRQLASFVES